MVLVVIMLALFMVVTGARRGEVSSNSWICIDFMLMDV